MSRHFGSNARHQAPGAFRIVLGQVQLFLQLSIDRLADQAQAIELNLSLFGADGCLGFFARCQQFQRVLLFQVALQSRIIRQLW